LADIKSTSNIILNNRKTLSLTGVKDIGKFDEHNITVFTTQGQLKVSGNNLKIGNLCTESGNLNLSGTINSLSYVSSNDINNNIFKKIFG